MVDTFLAKVNSKECNVGIVGLGYVGLPLALTAIEAGYPVTGFDIDDRKIECIQAGKTYIKHIDGDRISKAYSTGRLRVTTDFSEAGRPDCLILCVPTPLGKHMEPDMSYIVNTMDSLLPYVRAGQMVSLESTTYPGTTEECLAAPLREKGFVPGESIFIVYSPEREDPGNPNFETKTIPKVVGGYTPNCQRIGEAVYSKLVDQVTMVSSCEVAETAKLLENIYRAVNIGLVNEMKIVTDRMGIDIWEVVNAAKTKPFGFTAFYPGPGLGGHCIPIDPFYLTWKAREFGVHTRFIELAGEINHEMPGYVVNKVMEGLNAQGKALNGAKVLVLGIAYKKNIDDMRESPSVEIMELLQEKGARIDYCDPFVPTFPKMREYHFDLKSVEFDPETIQRYDAIVISTDHDIFDYEMLLKEARLIVDARGRYKRGTPKVVCA